MTTAAPPHLIRAQSPRSLALRRLEHPAIQTRLPSRCQRSPLPMRRQSLRLRAASSGCGRFLLRGARWRQAEVEGWSVEDVQTFFRCLRMPELADDTLEEQVDGAALWARDEPIWQSTLSDAELRDRRSAQRPMPEQPSCVWTIVQPLTPARHPILRFVCVHARPFRSVDQLLRLMRSPNPVAEDGAGSPLPDQVEKAVRPVRNVASWAAAAADGQEELGEAD